jgi:hypothetical protein
MYGNAAGVLGIWKVFLIYILFLVSLTNSCYLKYNQSDQHTRCILLLYIILYFILYVTYDVLCNIYYILKLREESYGESLG